MYIYAIDDIELADLGMSPALLTSDSDDLGFSVRRQAGIASQAFTGGANEPAVYSIVFRCPSVAVRDSLMTVLTGDLGTERRFLAQRLDLERTRVVGYAGLTDIERVGETDFVAEFEASDSVWTSESSVVFEQTISSSRDQAILVTPPGNVRTTPTIRIRPLVQRTAFQSHTGWTKRRRYRIENLADEPMYRYPVRIDLGDTAALVVAGKLQADGDDLRAWIHGMEQRRKLFNVNTTATQLWIIVSVILPGEYLDVDVVYGNPAATAPDDLLYPDDPAFAMSASTNASWVYRTDDIIGNIGGGLWHLTRSTAGGIADFGVPAAWQPTQTFDNPDARDKTQQPRSSPESGAYMASFLSSRVPYNNNATIVPNDFDGVSFYNPLGITSVRGQFYVENVGGHAAFVILQRDSSAEGWDKIFTYDTTTAGATITIATYDIDGVSAKWVALATWPKNGISIPDAALATDAASAKLTSDTTLAIDSSKMTITLLVDAILPFTPASLGGSLRAFYAADDIVGLADNSGVRQWDDSSGNGRHFTRTTDFPNYNSDEFSGYPAVEFDGNSEFMGAEKLVADTRDETVVVALR
ncbi:MAG: hypothetical protein H0U59_00625, partial [Gemmatimonadaceae bacterium]|nr:hypothetical protein [Gemmatimonadaceae bacterium]